MIGGLGVTELVIIFLIILILFGAGKIPKIAKDLGGGIREFKKSISGENDDDDKKKS
jgi:sec-independent protein translocase protein TatA